ncbi:uncharacterized protein LOC128721304 [Anopheles nili]|uniref:uncharacterized protein LOC128721304 n=1 Tax=Anopheles nili TaxID=185578 RepID=UPI00237C1D4A|nr:uncharacterized protein LOC128721304 [Anopheles nili]
MAVHLRVTQENIESSLKNPMKLHYIPATIKGDGPANLEQCFTPYTETQPDGTLRNALRGYPLHGKPTKVPEGFTGVIMQETKQPLSAEDDRTFTFAGAFRDFTYWNYDRVPSASDPMAKALKWMELADVLHCEDESAQDDPHDTKPAEGEKPKREKEN